MPSGHRARRNSPTNTPHRFAPNGWGTHKRSRKPITTWCVMRITPSPHRPRSNLIVRLRVSQKAAHLCLRMRLTQERRRTATRNKIERKTIRDRRLCRSLPSVAVLCRMNQWAYADLNHGHRHFQCRALPTELYAHMHSARGRMQWRGPSTRGEGYPDTRPRQPVACAKMGDSCQRCRPGVGLYRLRCTL